MRAAASLKRKGKERKSIYIAPFRIKVHTKRSGMDHTVLPANCLESAEYLTKKAHQYT